MLKILKIKKARSGKNHRIVLLDSENNERDLAPTFK